MELLRQMSKFTRSRSDKIHIYKTYIRSVVEQSCVVWNFNLKKRNEKELEKVQKVALSIITSKRNSYKENLRELGLETLKERRNILSARFANKCLKNKKTEGMFRSNTKTHTMNLRVKEKYKVDQHRTSRTIRSAIPNMVKVLNKKHNEKQKFLET